MSRSLIGALASAFFVVPVSAQTYRLTDANMSYAHRPHNNLPEANADISASTCSPDNTWSMNWIYSVAGSGFGTILNDTGHGSYTATPAGTATNIQTIVGVDGTTGLDIVIVETAVSTGPDSGHIDHMVTINNNTGAAITLNLYRYFDFDVGGDFGDDIVTAASGITGTDVRIQVVDDVSCNCCEFYGVGASAFEVSVYNGATATAPIAGANLTNTGLPFGPADFTGVVQWSLPIPMGGSQTIQAYTGHNDAFAGAASSSASLGTAVGSAGGMALSGDPATLGSNLTFTVSNAPATASSATLLLSFNPAPPVVPIFGLQVMGSAVAASAMVPLTGGSGSFSVAIGCDPMLAGVPIAAQAFAPDAASPATIPLGHSSILVRTIGD